MTEKSSFEGSIITRIYIRLGDSTNPKVFNETRIQSGDKIRDTIVSTIKLKN